MVAFWLPATNHCRLEQIPGLAFLVCCEHEESAPHQDNDCETDNCAAVEEGLYKTEDCHVAVIAPCLDQPLLLPSVVDDLYGNAHVLRRLFSIRFPLPSSWQFDCRAAAPPRAPSFAS